MPVMCLDTVLCTDRQEVHLKRDLEAKDLRSQSLQKVLLGNSILGRRNNRCKKYEMGKLSVLEEQKRGGLGKVCVSLLCECKMETDGAKHRTVVWILF